MAILVLVFPASAKTIDVSKKYEETIGQYFQIYQSTNEHVSLQGALRAFKEGYFSSSSHSIINFGIDSKPIWLALRVINSEPGAIYRNLLLETPWLDRVDVYFLQENLLVNSYHVGDHLRFYERPFNHRFFVTGHQFKYGETIILLRIASIDAMVLPIYFMSDEAITDRRIFQSYSYGFVYGVILALIAYNLLLYIGLPDSSSYLFYSIYLILFLILNISYTGHGYQWLWPESPYWQQWSNPVLIVTCSISGLIFALHFLNIRIALPSIYRIITRGWLGFSTLLLLTAIFSGSYAIVLLMSLTFIFLFSIFMVVLGVISLQLGNKFAKYFLVASVSTISGGAVTANAMWGFIPFNLFTYRAVEIGMMADAILLALALTERFNISQNEKLAAEKMAGIDPLTNLNNRRSFYKFVKPSWARDLRGDSYTSVIIIDIDNFKLFNDSYGHALGDQVLIRLAGTLQEEARSGDILARWGGEEFLIFLPETKLADAITIADRLRNRIAAIRIAIDKGNELSFTASFGVAGSKNIHTTLDDLIDLADKQLYHAKEQGRNCVRASQTD